MKRKSINGNGKPKPAGKPEKEEIVFPVSYQLKAVMTVEDGEDENRQRLTEVFSEIDIVYKYLKKKMSSKGSYVSFSFMVTINSREQMNMLYSELKKIKALKFAI